MTEMVRSFFIATFVFLTSTIAFAQVSCDYKLALFDSFADSWDGALVLVTINDDLPEVYTLTREDGDSSLFSFIVTEGDSLKLEFFGGSFDSEVSYKLLDTDNNVIFEDGSNPMTGLVFADTVACPSCPPPSESLVSFDDIRDIFVDVSFFTPDPNGLYLLQFDTTGFDPDSTGLSLFSNSGEVRIEDLAEKTLYDLYITSFCTTADTSSRVGPLTFETVFSNDVGIIDVLSPVTGCGLTGDDLEVEVTIKNFGANPQTLIPFDFNLNMQGAGVNMPIDGLFTGVLGKDSTFTIPFDVRSDALIPDAYELIAWTNLPNDSDRSNDSTIINIVNIPLIDTFPYATDFEEWFDGWIVDASNSQNASWEFGRPNYLDLNSAASGSRAWVTGLDTTYNNSEVSYLVSPCLDFSRLTENPIVNFSLYFQTESMFDRAWLEFSVNDGGNWIKVVNTSDAIGWYNDLSNQWWTGDGGFEGWTLASNVLPNAAGVANARLRFVFVSDGSNTEEGMGIDDFFVSTPLANDLLALRVANGGDENCGDPRDEVTLRIRNQGTQTRSNFGVAYQVNNGAIIQEQFTDTLAVGAVANYTFDATFRSDIFGAYVLRAWTIASEEDYVTNDTALIVFRTAEEVPYLENFEGRQLPPRWNVEPAANNVTNQDGTPSFVLSGNISNLVPFFDATSPVVGEIEAGDSLRFAYRFVDDFTNNPTQLSSADSMLVRISTDCGDNYETIFSINNTNHNTSDQLTTVTLPLDEYVGTYIKIRFIAFWGAGDYVVNIDDVTVLRCPSNFLIGSTVVNESKTDAMDGAIAISPSTGLAPFTYQWSNEATTKDLQNISAGTYTVTVTDAIGCSGTTTVVVDIATSVEEIDPLTYLQLSPNPTQQSTRLDLTFDQLTEFEVAIYNAVGQRIRQYPAQKALQTGLDIDLWDQAAGIYYIRIQLEGTTHTERLVLIR